MPSTKAVGGGIFSGVFNKDVKVPHQEAELVGTSSSNTKLVLSNVTIISRESPICNTLMKKKQEEPKKLGFALGI